ncbi:MAG TPA: alpha/beta fold hydrolase [Candidatus Nanopelagicaceae bacterium]|nr:alpha/beta fold hydrolase [Candidatus Nanopelagicaceae bacterium]
MPCLSRDGVRIHYFDSGSGHPVLFHTGGAGDGRMWAGAGYLEQLPGLRHLVMDHRGHKQSGLPPGREANRLQEYVADCLAVLDDAGVEKAAVIGYSKGGRVLFELAARHPTRVAALVNLGGVAHPDESQVGRREAAGALRRSGLRSTLQAIAERETKPPPDWLMGNLSVTDDEMSALEMEAWADAPTECGMFPQIQVPALLIVGELETPDQSAQLAARALPRGEVMVLPRAGHLEVFWKTEQTGPRIREFLDRAFSGMVDRERRPESAPGTRQRLGPRIGTGPPGVTEALAEALGHNWLSGLNPSLPARRSAEDGSKVPSRGQVRRRRHEQDAAAARNRPARGGGCAGGAPRFAQPYPDHHEPTASLQPLHGIAAHGTSPPHDLAVLGVRPASDHQLPVL